MIMPPEFLFILYSSLMEFEFVSPRPSLGVAIQGKRCHRHPLLPFPKGLGIGWRKR